MVRHLACVIIVLTAVAAACGTSDEPASVGTGSSTTTTTAPVPSTTTEPATTVTRPPEPPPPEPEAGASAHPDAIVDDIASKLHLLLPREPEAAAILGMAPTYLWWFPTDSPDAVFLDGWWDLPAIGCGVYSSRGEDPDGVETVIQLAVYPTPEAARAGAGAAAGVPRFAGATELAAPRGFDDGAGFVVTDPPFVEEEGFAPPVVRWFSMGRIDRVLVAGGIRVDGERDVGAELSELMEAVAARAGRFAELTADPDPVPGGFPQPMPAILFAGPDPTFDSLGLGEIESGSWSVRRCDEGDCREVYYDGELFTYLTLETFTGVPWQLEEGLREGRLGAALVEWAADTHGGEVVLGDRGLVRQLDTSPLEARLGAWGLHETSVLWIGVGDLEFEALDPALVLDFTPVFDALVGVTAPEPSGPRFLYEAPPGSFCRDLAAFGFDYSQAVAYWMSEGRPARMDADRNGVPCETVYPAAELEARYGSAGALDVTVVATFGADRDRFVATGPAVDAGLLCPMGVPRWVGGEGEDRWEDEYTCDDGSGTFVIGADIHLSGERLYEAWEIVSGTGAYAGLSGGGGADTGPTPDGEWADNLFGRVERAS